MLLLADVIASQGVATIIAVDVGSEDNNDLTNYGDHISGWYLLWNKINPFAKKIRVRTLNREADDVMCAARVMSCDVMCAARVMSCDVMCAARVMSCDVM